MLWNALFRTHSKAGLNIGLLVRDGEISKRKVFVPHHRRAEHIAIVGKTGSGKSSLLRHFMSQDVKLGRGFVCIDLHGDLIPYVLSVIAKEEQRTGRDLSGRLLLVDPADPKYACGLNLIECQEGQNRTVQISEMVALLKQRWGLEQFGARTEELLRNSLWVLSENNLTLLEISLLLTNEGFRAGLLKNISNQEVKAYFEERFNRASSAMQTVMREAVLNKITAFTVDPGLRCIIGQAKSSFSLRDSVDQEFWVCLSLRKSALGENALTFAGLFLAKLKAAIFGRLKRNLFSVYADELPNLVAANDAFETFLSEARKFSVSIVTANQFLSQLSAQMRSALFSVGTSLCFQLSAEDAPFMAKVLDGERTMQRTLVTLPHRHLICRLSEQSQEVFVQDTKVATVSTSSLVQRSLKKFGKLRSEIENEINARKQSKNNLETWD